MSQPAISDDHSPPCLSVRPDQAARLLNLSRSALYTLLSSGQIKSRRAGKARLIAITELERWLAANDD